MSTRIKICCIASHDEARQAIDAGADAIGCVGARPPSPRTIPDDQIGEILDALPAGVAGFLLTTERTAQGISDHVRRTRPTAVQILAQLDPAELGRLAQLEPTVRRVQVIHVEAPRALDLIPACARYVHAFLLDSGDPSGPAGEFGGTGRPHDWKVSAQVVRRSERPVFLAGGLSAANVAAAIRQVRPFAVDLCAGVRTDGRLDPDKLARFMATVRQADDGLRPAEGRGPRVGR